MIKNRKELRRILEREKELYFGHKNSLFKERLLKCEDYLLFSYLRDLRKKEYYVNSRNRIMQWVYSAKVNIKGARLGFSIPVNTIGEGLRIWHVGTIIINGHAVIGENCQLHGMNCIGNKGDHAPLNAPIIGDNVDIGVGAVIIGGIRIANDCVIGANAVVTRDCLEKGAILVGNPAKVIGRKTHDE